MSEPLVLQASIIKGVIWMKSPPSPVYKHSFWTRVGRCDVPPEPDLIYFALLVCLKGAPATATSPIDRVSRLPSFEATKLTAYSLHVKAAGLQTL